MKKIKFLLPLLAFVGVTSACTSDSEPSDTIFNQTYNPCYSIATTGSEAPVVTSPVIVNLEQINITKGTVTVTLHNIMANSTLYPEITLSNMKFSPDKESWGNVSETTPTVTTPGVVVTDFKMRWINRSGLLDNPNGNYPGLVYSFMLNSTTFVTGSTPKVVFAGTTTSTPEGGDAYTTNRPQYALSLDFANRKATIDVHHANFSAGMPELNMQFADIPFTIENMGKEIVLDNPSLIPSIGGTPYPSFPITELKGKFTPGTGFELQFICDFRGTPYTVKTKTDYTLPATN